jgi:hypothetical protein
LEGSSRILGRLIGGKFAPKERHFGWRIGIVGWRIVSAREGIVGWRIGVVGRRIVSREAASGLGLAQRQTRES